MKTLNGHRRGIACLQYTDNLIASGSSDYTIRLWNVDPGICLRVLEGHQDLVRCLKFDEKYIVSGAYDGTIKGGFLKSFVVGGKTAGTEFYWCFDRTFRDRET